MVGAALLASPAAAGTIFSWRTAEGDFAFTDDAKKVPARYRDQVKTRETAQLGDYERYTSQHAEGTSRYAAELAQRVEHLRAVNTPPVVRTAAVASVRDDARIAVGGLNLRVPASGENDGPIIVERIRVLRPGQITTRHDTVVRQGDRTLAIVRGRQEGELGGASSIRDEDDLERYR